ncbi:MAG: hypothetical protein J6T48_08950 [Bacteroidales bacterium]|nr:hypothetical protein [Bacteroidales bacterium]
MNDRDSFRGTSIDEKFAKSFKESLFFKKIYKEHKNEIIIGVRDSYINLYYNCDSIALIDVSNPKKCETNSYYTNNGKKCLTDVEFKNYYDTIKANSNKRDKLEKQAQQRLFIDNNNNSLSDWYCIDVEYTKSLKGKKTAEDWRFDIIAISKEPPFRIAFIELKYGNGALGGASGIRTHVKDYYAFFKNNFYESLLPEIVSIINKLIILGVDNIPCSLENISCEQFAPVPEFYFITLNNNPEYPSEKTPKSTMSGYLFGDKRWGCRRVSSLINKEGDYFDLIEHDKSFKPVFLFSNSKLPDLRIPDILNKDYYDDVEIIEK